MTFLRKMVVANLTVGKSRVALTVAAVALSVSLVISVTSGYASLFESAFTYLNQYMGQVDARIGRIGDGARVPEKLVDDLRRDPDVRRVDGRLSISIPMNDPEADPPGPRSVRIVGLDRPSDRRSEKLTFEAGKWFDTNTGGDVVIDQGVGTMLNIGVGGKVTIPYAGQKIDGQVVGIVHKPAVLTSHIKTIYVPLRSLQKLVNADGYVSSIQIDLVSQADHRAFEKRWRQALPNYDKNLTFRLTSDNRSQMDDNLQGIGMMQYLGSAVSMLAATFIIFSALSMGVSERQRSLAMLRAVGAFKHQIGALVVAEGFLFSTAGLIVGVPLGWLWVKILTLMFPDVFAAGVVFSWTGLAFGAGGTLLTALLASALPAWTATRVDPLAAMTPLAQPPANRAPIGWAIAGILLASIDPFLMFGPLERIAVAFGAADPDNAARSFRFYCHFAAGLPGLFIGFFLLAPMCVWAVERVAGPIVAALLGVKYSLLRQQVSSGLWRAAGTSASLMVGLAVLLVMQINGHTVLSGWKLPDKFADVFIGTLGLTPEQTKHLAETPGINELMAIEIATTSLGSAGGNPFAIGTTMFLPNSTMWIGMDPDKAFRMMQLDFRLGTAKEAEQRLKEGDWVIVTQEYRQLKKDMKLGDPIVLGGHTFRIAAVIWSPGIDVMVGMYDMGDQFEQRTVSSVFGSLADGEKYFGARPYLFAADLKQGVERVDLIKQIKKDLNLEGLKVGDVREIKFKIESGFYRLLHLMSTVAFAAMAVASLGVTNTIMAGIRSRRWQFGILRSIGATRGQLVRLVMAEALLLGLMGCVLGLSAGAEMSGNANAMTRLVIGYNPPLVIPWHVVGIGVAAVIVVALCASIWPAVHVARAEPLSLLQAGRSAT